MGPLLLLALTPLLCLPLAIHSPLALIVAAHLAYGAAFAVAARRARPHAAMQAVLLVLCLPFVGGLAAWVRLHCESRPNLLESEPSLALEPLPPEPSAPIEAASVLDALLDGSLQQKLEALAALRCSEGDALRLLRRRLGDPAPLTRLVVTLELVRRESALSDALHHARSAWNPASSDARVRLARAACAYAESGLPPVVSQTALWRECLEALPNDDTREVHALRARASLALGDLETALDACERALQHAPDAAEILLLKCNILHQKKAYQPLRQVLKRAKTLPESRRRVDFWLQQLQVPAALQG